MFITKHLLALVALAVGAASSCDVCSKKLIDGKCGGLLQEAMRPAASVFRAERAKSTNSPQRDTRNSPVSGAAAQEEVTGEACSVSL